MLAMGVPADPNVKQFNVYLPLETIRALKHHAVETEQSLSAIVDAAVVEYLARRRPKKGATRGH